MNKCAGIFFLKNRIQNRFASVTKWRMSDIMSNRNSFNQILIQF